MQVVSRATSARDQLLATASSLFYERGIAATGVDAVVQASGVSKPTLYAHFGSKAELVAAVLEARHDQRIDQLRAWLEDVADPRERPLAVFAWLGDWYARDGARGCGFLNAAAELSDPDEPGRSVVMREKRWLTDLLAELNREAGLRDPERLASQLLLLIDGVSSRVLVWGPAAAPAAIGDATHAAAALIAGASRPG
jgi:AcrR family transcriptional regulator